MSTAQLEHPAHKTRHHVASAPAAISNPTTSNQNLYDQLFSAIQEAYLSDFIGSNNQLLPNWQFQFPNPVALQSAVWVNLVGNNFQKYQMFEAGDLAPISKQGSFTASSSSPSIWDYYGLWLGAVMPPGVNTLPAYVEAQQQALVDAQSMADAVNGAGPAFTTWQQQNPGSPITTVTMWLSQIPQLPQAQPFANNYQSALADYTTQMNLMAQIVATANPDLSAAQTAYGNKTNQTTYATASGVTVTAGIGFVGANDGSENPVTDWTAWSQGKPNADLRPFTATVATGVQPITTVKEITLTTTVEHSYFFGLISCTETEQETFFESITTDANFQLDMNWASLFMYPITRPGWFDATVLKTYADDPISPSNQIDFFSDTDGVLYLVPSFIFLGWNPALTLTLSTALYTQWQSQINSPQGVWLNGIEVAGPPASVTTGANDTTIIQYGSQSSTASMLQLPTIVGYIHEVPTGTA